MKHSWKYNGAWGVENGCGRPHGIDESWTCRRCGAKKSRGPASTCTGKRVIRWSYFDAQGYECDRMPECEE
jgi:hypothetical protein